MSELFSIDRELGEEPVENEAQLAQGITDLSARHIAERPRPAHRGAHPKPHGIVRAEFIVEANLPVHLAQGVFAPGKRYNAWVRFSNGDPDPSRADATGDARGMAIKLLDVPGEKILPEERDATTQDFVMINNPVFFVDDAARYLKLAKARNSTCPFAKVGQLLAIGLKGALVAKKLSSITIASPLQTRYWSMTPYRLGDAPHKLAIKFSARPHMQESPAVPANPRHDYLREVLIKQLAEGEARFDFEIQVRAPAMSVERSMVEWPESEAPFVKVATIVIPKQVFATPEQDQFGENLSFTPWHALPQHRPLGSINRCRRIIYQTTSILRHKLNGAPMGEPVGPELKIS